MISGVLKCLLFLFACSSGFSMEENFLLVNGKTDESILELGPHVDERVTPCSTFKIALSLICEQALKQQGIQLLQIEASPTAYSFYKKLGYVEMPFNNPDGEATHPNDRAMGKCL